MKKKILVPILAAVLVITAVVLGVVFIDKDSAEQAFNSVFSNRAAAKAAAAEYKAEVYESMRVEEPDFDNLVEGTDYAADQIILAYSSDEERDAMEQVLAASGASTDSEIMDGVILVNVPEGSSTQAFYQTLKDELGTVAAQPNYLYEVTESDTYDAQSVLDSQSKRFYKGQKDAGDAESTETAAADSSTVEFVTEEASETLTANDPMISNQWFLDAVGAVDAWSSLNGFTSGSGVTVAVLDTGIDLSHPDLSGQIAGGTCFTGENITGQDNNGHGTMVAGIIAAKANNSIGVSGVAPGAKLLAVKVMTKAGTGSSANIIKGINYAVSKGADVINMSLASAYYDSLMNTAISNAANAGVVVVCAAGNSSSSAGSWPSDCEDAISVTSTGSDGTFSSFSNYGEAKDIAAPGENMTSTAYSKTYKSGNGTSFAAPVVAGVAALLLDADSTLSVSEVKDILYTSADDLGASGKDIYYGYGQVNAEKAVMLALDIGEQDSAYTVTNEKEVQSAIDYDGDSDWFTYTAAGDADILVNVQGLDSEVMDVSILSSDLEPVAETTPAVSQQAAFSAVDGETYYICIKGFEGAVGNYSVKLYQDVIGGTKADAFAVSGGTRAGSYIETSTDVDAYTVHAEANTDIVFGLTVDDSAKSAQMVIEDTNGDVIYTGSETSTDDTFSTTCTVKGDYTVYVSSTQDLPPFSLSFTRDTNVFSIASSSTIGVNDKLSGELETVGDIDYFTFTAPSNGDFYFNSIGGTDVAVTLTNSVGTVLGSNDDIAIPGRTGWYYYNCGLSCTLTSGETYTYALQSLNSDTGDYAVSLTTYDPDSSISMPDTAVQSFFRTYYALTSASQVPMSVLLMTDYMAVNTLTYTTNLSKIRNLETLYVYNSPSLTSVSAFGDLPYLEYAVFSNTGVTSLPASLDSWDAIRYFEVNKAKVTELPDWSSSSTLERINVSGNFIDFSSTSASETNAVAMETAGITVDRGKQKSLSKVTLVSSVTTPKAYQDFTLTAAATSTVITVGDRAEYKFEASYKGGDWETISDWGDGTITWYADGVGSWRIRASARMGGNEADTGISVIKTITVANPTPITTGRVTITDVSSNVIRVGEDITLGIDVDTSDIPARYELEYRVIYNVNGGTWANVSGLGWDDYPTAGLTEIELTTPITTTDVTYRFAVEIRVKGVATTTLFDRSNLAIVKMYTIMPLQSVTLTGVGNGTPVQVVPTDGITLKAEAVNRAGYEETPVNQFSYRNEGTTAWTNIPVATTSTDTTTTSTSATVTTTTNSSINFIPTDEGTYYFRVEAMSSGRSTFDVINYDYQGYTLYSNAKAAKAVYNLSAEKKDYVNGENVTLNLDIAQNEDGDPVEYRLWYSVDGKNYTMLQDYLHQILALGETYDAKITVPTLPAVAKDTIYYIKVAIRTEGRTSEQDACAVTTANLMVAYPIKDGEVSIVNVGDNSEQQYIGTGVTLTSTTRSNTQYRYAFQKEGATKWTYISTAWSDLKSIVFIPSTEGKFRFRVEARATGRVTIDTVSTETAYYSLYKTKMGARMIDISSATTSLVNDVTGNNFNVTYSAEGNGTDYYQTRFLYSPNGITYKVLEDWTTSTGTGAVTDVAKTLKLPAVAADTHFYVKAEIRSLTRTTVDSFDICEVQVYKGEPLASMDDFESDATGGIRVLETTADKLVLTANASGSATYKFYYRLEGKTTWTLIPATSVSGNEAYFRPLKEGSFEFKATAIATGRTSKTPDVSAELGEAVQIYFVAEPAQSVDMTIADEDNDYIIGTDTEATLHITADGNSAGMDYRIMYSRIKTGGYLQLTAWQSLTTDSTFDGDVSVKLPGAIANTEFYLVAQVRSTGRTATGDVASSAQQIWRLTKERNLTADLTIDGDTYEYGDTITAHIAVSEPASGVAEYLLKVSSNGVNWYSLAAYDWTEYDDGGSGSIDVDLDLSGFSADTKLYIRLNTRIQGSTTVEDYSVDSFNIYSIAPVTTAELAATLSGEEYVTLTTTADDGGFNNDKEYLYSYALAGKTTTTWVDFTSWITSDEIVFKPSDSGDYMFKVQVKSAGRTKVDIIAKATNDLAGYHLESVEDLLFTAAEAEPEETVSATATPVPSPTVSASAAPSATPTASADAVSIAAEPEMTSLEFAQGLALGEDADISAYTETEVKAEDLLNVVTLEEAPKVIIQLGEDVYSVITGYALNEAGEVVGFIITDQTGETILGGTEGILKAWYYVPAVEATPAPTASAIPSPTIAPSASAAAE